MKFYGIDIISASKDEDAIPINVHSLEPSTFELISVEKAVKPTNEQMEKSSYPFKAVKAVLDSIPKNIDWNNDGKVDAKHFKDGHYLILNGYSSIIGIYGYDFAKEEEVSDKIVLDPSVTSLQLFIRCSSLVTAPVLDTKNITSMECLFVGCHKLMNVPKYNTSKVENFRSMFAGCSALKEVPEMDTSRGKNFETMFSGCESLENIPGDIDMTSATIWERMFENCTKLKGLKIKNAPKNLKASDLGLNESQFTIISYRTTEPAK